MKHSKLAILGLAVLGSALAAPIAFAQSTTATQDATATSQSQSQDPTATQSGTATDGSTTQGTTNTQGATSSQGTTTTQGQDAWSQGTGNSATTTQGNATHDGAHSGSAGAATGAAPGDSARQVTWTDLDVDKDGSLSRTEVTQLPSLSQVFDQADADADSKLTADEYKAYVAKNGKTGSASDN